MFTKRLQKEIERGEGIYVGQLLPSLPSSREGKPVSLSCVIRWITEGARGPDGGRVKLEAGRIGNKWMTTRAAYGRFVARQSVGAAAMPRPRSAGKETRASARAARRLEKMGV